MNCLASFCSCIGLASLVVLVYLCVRPHDELIKLNCRYCWFLVQLEVLVLQLCRLEKSVVPLLLLLLGTCSFPHSISISMYTYFHTSVSM